MPVVGTIAVDRNCPEHGRNARPYAPGDRVVITGDRADWGHRFDIGQVVTVEQFPTATPGEVFCRGEDRPFGYSTGWYVHLLDLKPYEGE